MNSEFIYKVWDNFILIWILRFITMFFISFFVWYYQEKLKIKIDTIKVITIHLLCFFLLFTTIIIYL